MSRRTVHLLLIGSLIVNIFMVGGVIGAALMWHRTAQAPALTGIGRPARLRQAALQLSPPYRVALRQALRRTIVALRPQAQAARAARGEAGRLLIQSAFDRAAIDAALARARQADLAIRTRLETDMMGFAAGLPADQRIILGRALIRTARDAGGREVPPFRSAQSPGEQEGGRKSNLRQERSDGFPPLVR